MSRCHRLCGMRSFLLSTAAVLLSIAAAVEDGNLMGVFLNVDDGVCSLWSISPSTGENKTIGPTTVCIPPFATFPSYAALSSDSASLIVAVAKAAAIYDVSLDSGKTKDRSAVVYNSSDAYIGLVSFNADQTFLVSNFHVYQVNGTTPVEILSYDFPTDAQVAGSPNGGTGGAPMLYVHDGESDYLYIVDLGKNEVSYVRTGINKLLDMQYDSGAQTTGYERLIVVIGYQLSAYDLAGKKLHKIGPIPDGPGYPRVNSLSPSGKTLAIMDFQYIFTLDTMTGEVGPKFPFSYAPKVVGFPQWVA